MNQHSLIWNLKTIKVPQSATVFHPPLFLHLSDIILTYREIKIFFSLYKRQETANDAREKIDRLSWFLHQDNRFILAAKREM